MTIKEHDLIIPSLKIIYENKNGITTSDLLELLRQNLKPTGEDLKILENRNDDKFSQKVRNLKSHKTLENLGYARFHNNCFFITDKGKAELLNSELNFSNNINIYKENIILFSLISENDLPIRIKNFADENNIKYVFELLIFYTENNMMSIPALGKGTISLLINFFKVNKLNTSEIYQELKLNDPYKFLTSKSDSILLDNLTLFTSIYQYQFPARIENFCNELNITFVYELFILIKSTNKNKLPNIGKGSLQIIEKFFLEKNLNDIEIYKNLISIDVIQFMKDHNDEINKFELSLNLKTNYIDEFFFKNIENSRSKDKIREIKIVCSRYGLRGHKKLTLQAIGEFYNISRERIRQIQSKSISRIKKTPQLKSLLEIFYKKIESFNFITLDELQKKNLLKYDFNYVYLNEFHNDISLNNEKSFLVDKLEDKYFYFKNKKFYSDAQKIILFIKRTDGLNKQFTSFDVLLKKYKDFFAKVNIIYFLEQFDDLLIDVQKKVVFYYKSHHFIRHNISKIKNIINDKFSINDLYSQINRHYRRHIPSKKILIEYLQKGDYNFDDNYLYFDNIETEKLSKLEQNLVNYIINHNNRMFVEDISEFAIECDYELNSSILVYLKNNPLFKNIAKNIFTLANVYLSPFQIIEFQNQRDDLNKKYKSNYETSWADKKFKVILQPAPYTISFCKFFIKSSILDIIGLNSEFECINLRDVMVYTTNNTIYSNSNFFTSIRVRRGDKVEFIFDLENKFVSIDKITN